MDTHLDIGSFKTACGASDEHPEWAFIMSRHIDHVTCIMCLRVAAKRNQLSKE